MWIDDDMARGQVQCVDADPAMHRQAWLSAWATRSLRDHEVDGTGWQQTFVDEPSYGQSVKMAQSRARHREQRRPAPDVALGLAPGEAVDAAEHRDDRTRPHGVLDHV